MKKALVIDFVVLKKLGLTYEDLLYLYWLQNQTSYGYPGKDYDTKNLEGKYIKIDKNNEPHLRQEGLDLLEYLSIESFKKFENPKIIKKSKKKISAEVVERIDEYRIKWKGRKAGAMGDKKSCIDKLSRWMETNPEYSFDDILQAADIYLETEGTNRTYLQRADYFIYKQDNNKEETSRLSAFIDEIGTEMSTDWTSTLN